MVKTAIIGYGYMGEIRKRVITAHPECQLAMICETDPDKISGISNLQITGDAQQVINSNVDLVFICTPNHLIPPLAIECMKRGKHVFCEKPPGRNLEDIQAIQAQEKKSNGIKLMFGFNHRYHPGILRAKNLIDTGAFGRILWLRGIYGKSGGANFHQSWRNQKEVSGGGILLDQGIHMLDLFNLFCGDFQEVKAYINKLYWDFEVEDNAFVILENTNRQNATLHSSATLWKHRFQIDIGLEGGYMTIEGLLSKSGSYGRETLKIGRKQFENEADAVGNPSEEITYFDKDMSWEIEVNKIVEAIKNDLPIMESNSEDALKVMKIIEAAYKSSNFKR